MHYHANITRMYLYMEIVLEYKFQALSIEHCYETTGQINNDTMKVLDVLYCDDLQSNSLNE